MKPNNVSVSVSQFNGELFVNITMSLKHQPLDYESAVPPKMNSVFADVTLYGKRVLEGSRARKCKLLKRFIEQLEFQDD